MYPYHNRIKQRIRAGELVDYYFTATPESVRPLVLVFNTAPFLRPIRPERYGEYVYILSDWMEKKGV